MALAGLFCKRKHLFRAAYIDDKRVNTVGRRRRSQCGQMEKGTYAQGSSGHAVRVKSSSQEKHPGFRKGEADFGTNKRGGVGTKEKTKNVKVNAPGEGWGGMVIDNRTFAGTKIRTARNTSPGKW